jgi:hypothetical protein
MEETNSKSEDLSVLRATAELQKLNLEIEGLKRKHRWEAGVAVYIPLLTVLVAVGGFLFGIYQFQTQQKLQQDRAINEQQKDRLAKDREQSSRIQDQIHRDADQILQFTSNKEITISRVGFILSELKQLLDYPSEDQMIAKNLSDQKKEITKSIRRMIAYDCDFTNPRDVSFVRIIISDWDDYLKDLKTNTSPTAITFILSRYLDGLDSLRRQNPKVIKAITYDTETNEYNNIGSGVPLYYTFDDLVQGFNNHLALLEGNQKLKTRYIRDFQGSTCNPTITKQIFSENFTDQECLN